MGHSPSVTELGFLGLELRGLREDTQGVQKGTLLKQALALGTQGAVTSACIPGLAALMRGGGRHWGGSGERQETATETFKSGETLRHRDGEKYRAGESEHEKVRNIQLRIRQQYRDTGTKRNRKSGR